ncbi:MAG: DUF5688 family protein [Lachnospiraceae bacterium]|nr:DUF5688 family protein [Lachnospiraceae bacterium]
MEYTKFLEEVENRIREQAGENYTVTRGRVVKNNGMELDGISICEKGYNVAPTMYLNSLFEEYVRGQMRMDEVIGSIWSTYQKHKEFKLGEKWTGFGPFEEYRRNIIYRLVNYEQNKALLENIPHRRFLDLALTYHCVVAMGDEGVSTFRIFDSVMSAWGIDEETLWENAKENTPRLFPCKIQSMSEIMQRFLGEMMGEEDWPEDATETFAQNIYVISNERENYGAAAILYKDALEDFAQEMEQDYYILPSSIHEGATC